MVVESTIFFVLLGSEICPKQHGQVAQVVEHRSEKPGVVGASPTLPTLARSPLAGERILNSEFRYLISELTAPVTSIGAVLSSLK